MNQYNHNLQQLQGLMQVQGILSLTELSRRSGIDQREIYRLLYGLIGKIQIETLVKLAQTLNVSLNQLLGEFWSRAEDYPILSQNTDNIEALKRDYQLLEKQQDNLQQEFQQSVLNIIESWLLQWPTVVAIVKENPKFPANNLIPLVKPLENLLTAWGIEAIGKVGEELPYDPQLHQLMEGIIPPEGIVKVRYLGYRQGEKLLYKAKVSIVE
ncbi:MAG: nucleotide exchange factor GrpE [Gloeocapsa sp. DLM2.Bin57]|nr:MAG: nucleotide exchange factor GrpE [Gloeocapsa sp. DLM2.Bin57]